MNRNLPARCEVLVLGAGPAGSACAQMLAHAGREVLLIDRSTFPRDKACGDGLIPDAHRALARLGVHEAVAQRAQWATHVGCVGPGGRRLDVPGRLAVLPREQLDALLLDAAIQAGARFEAPWRLIGPLEAGGRTVGARLQQGQTACEVRADWTVLATGAAAEPLEAMGVCTRRSPSAIALRGYVRHEALQAGHNRTMDVLWHRRFDGGYGWIFPCRDGVFNIGVGRFGRVQSGTANLRALLDAFCAVHPVAAELMRDGALLGPFKGAPLRCSLEGTRLCRPGLLVAGEAAGSTYAFTGEGIGKAMETGMLAADSLLSGGGDAAVQSQYARAISKLKPRFALYHRAQRINHHPWLIDLLLWRAAGSASLQRSMAGVLEETSNPGRLLSLYGLRRLLRPDA